MAWHDNILLSAKLHSTSEVTLYPGLLTPAFVACSTNVGEGLVKLITCNDIPGLVEEWHLPGKTASKWVRYQHTQTVERLRAWYQTVSWVQKATLQLYRRNVPLLHMSRYVIARDQFYQTFPCVSTPTTGPGYEATLEVQCAHAPGIKLHIIFAVLFVMGSSFCLWRFSHNRMSRLSPFSRIFFHMWEKVNMWPSGEKFTFREFRLLKFRVDILRPTQLCLILIHFAQATFMTTPTVNYVCAVTSSCSRSE